MSQCFALELRRPCQFSLIDNLEVIGRPAQLVGMSQPLRKLGLRTEVGIQRFGGNGILAFQLPEILSRFSTSNRRQGKSGPVTSIPVSRPNLAEAYAASKRTSSLVVQSDRQQPVSLWTADVRQRRRGTDGIDERPIMIP